MDFEKVKEFAIEKKFYLITGIILLIVGFYLKKGDLKENDSQPENAKIMQSSSLSSSRATVNAETQSNQTKTITCDISGAVRHQGVYTLKNDARLQELIEAAGGTVDKAQLKAINRAVLLKDQDKIHIPYKGEKVESVTTTGTSSKPESTNNSAGTSTSSSSQSSGEKINLNTASVADLQKLTGIGEKKAEQIIAYREQNGTFKKPEDLMQVSGIGEKTFASLKDQLAV